MNHSILHNQFYVQYFKKQSLNNFNKIYSLLNKKDFFFTKFLALSQFKRQRNLGLYYNHNIQGKNYR